MIYDKYDELDKESELIVEGYFCREATQKIEYAFDDHVQKEVVDGGTSTNTFKVARVLKGDKNVESVDVCQSYYYENRDGKPVYFNDSEMTPMKNGEHWVLFLHKYDGHYWTTGDYTGRYAVPSDKEIECVKNNKKIQDMSREKFGIATDVMPYEKMYKQLIEKYYLK